MPSENQPSILEKIVRLDCNIASAQAKLDEPLGLADRGKLKDLVALLIHQRELLSAELESGGEDNSPSAHKEQQ
jgi:hypothetical protein